MKKALIFKIIPLLLLAAVLISSLSLWGCGKKSVTDGAKSTAEDLQVVGKVGEYDVLYDEYRYVVLSCKASLEREYGKDIWSDEAKIAEYSPVLEKMVAERITANYAVLSLCKANGYEDPLHDKSNVKYVNAKIENEIYLMALDAGYSVEVKKKLNGEIKYVYNYGELKKAKELFAEALEKSNLTERVMRLTLGTEYAFSKLSEILTSEKNAIPHKAEDIEAYMKSDKFICTKHVFIENNEKRSRDELLAEAQTVISLYTSGEMTMNKLIGSKYNKDISMPYGGYYFTYGEMDEAYEKAAFELKEGEVSGIVEADDGFYVIWRCQKDENYMLNNLEDFANQIIFAQVNERVRSHQSNLYLEKNDFSRGIVLHEVK